jgi:hypothetical protein
MTECHRSSIAFSIGFRAFSIGKIIRVAPHSSASDTNLFGKDQDSTNPLQPHKIEPSTARFRMCFLICQALGVCSFFLHHSVMVSSALPADSREPENPCFCSLTRMKAIEIEIRK